MSGGGRQDERGGGRDEGDDLVALLYGELDGETERAVRARVAADPALAARLAEMKRVRQVFGALPDEEPPPAITAQLLAQAARGTSRRAAQSGEPTGLWSRLRAWMQPVVAHPGLAAAASALVIAGVAGALLSRKGSDLARPRHAEPAVTAASSSKEEVAGGETRATDPARADQLDQTVAGGDERTGAEGEVGGAAAAAPEGGGRALEDGADDKKVAKARPRPRPRGERGAARMDGEKKAAEEPARGTALGLNEKEPAPQAAPREAASDDEAPADRPAPAPTTAPPAGAPGGKAPAPADVRELHKRAVAAASNRRCLEAQSLAERIRALDAAYHDKVVRRDKRLAVCLAASRKAK